MPAARSFVRRLADRAPRLKAAAKTAAMRVGLKPDSGVRIAAFLDVFSRSRTGEGRPGLRVLQVGANDGVRSDPLFELIVRDGWRGVLAEPIPALFERLCETHRGRPGLVPKNVAVAPEPGTRTLYYVDDPAGDLPDWTNGTGSFLRDSLVAHEAAAPGLTAKIAEIEVPCLTPAQLCEEQGWDRVDFVHVDTEGFDYQILRAIDFDRFPPDLLLFEWVHLSGDDRRAARELLGRHGYETVAGHWDAIALRDPAGADPDVAAAWRELTRRLAKYDRPAGPARR